MKNAELISKRKLIKNSASLLALTALGPVANLFSFDKKRKYQIGACDWSIGKRNEVDALEVAKKIGLDGVQVSLGDTKNNMHLRKIEIQKAYKAASKQFGVKISSLGIGELNNIPYKSDPRTEEWVSDSIDVAKAFKCQVILLAFFGNGDLKGDEEGTKEVIRRLKKVAPKAEKEGIILGIESWLSADEHLDIIHDVGSENVKVYYDVANSHKMGYNIYNELSTLGKKYICEIHAKENGFLLGQGEVDFPRVKGILDSINYDGWVIIEGAVPNGGDLLESYVKNREYLGEILNGE